MAWGAVWAQVRGLLPPWGRKKCLWGVAGARAEVQRMSSPHLPDERGDSSRRGPCRGFKGSREWRAGRKICQRIWTELLLHVYLHLASVMGKRGWVLPSSVLKPGEKVSREGPWTSGFVFFGAENSHVLCSVTQSRLTLRPRGLWLTRLLSAHGIFQAGIQEWVANSSSRGSSRPRD